MIKKDELLKAAYTIQEYCSSFENEEEIIANCLFANGRTCLECPLRIYRYPQHWGIIKEKKVTYSIKKGSI